MNTAEIECILRRALEPFEVQFADVFAADTVPNVREFPSCYVVNSDPASKPGEHWVACYAKSEDDAEFFDSYGAPVGAYPQVRIPNTITNHNDISLQAFDSNACGHFCIFYLIRRAQALSLRRIVMHLSAVPSAQRDRLVRSFVYRTTIRLHIRRPCQGACVGSQCCGKQILQ